MADLVLTSDNLTIGYAGARGAQRVVAAQLAPSLPAGTLVCLLGPNGAGKSTLLRTLAGMQPPLQGEVMLAGQPISGFSARDLARRLSVVLTERVQVGLLTAYELVALGRHPYTSWTGRLSAADHAVVVKALDVVGATPLGQRKVLELSDGERQKVLIARALAQEPLVILLDEPTAFLDLPRRVEVMHILRALAHEEGRSVLLSTHDLDLALRNADLLWLLTPEGLLHAGTPEDLVLSGAFEATFAAEGVRFNRETGTFDIDRPVAGHLDLIGEGLPAIWTGRALERAGYEVTRGPNGSARRVQVLPEAGNARWQVREGQQNNAYESVAALLAALQARDASGSGD